MQGGLVSYFQNTYVLQLYWDEKNNKKKTFETVDVFEFDNS